MSTESDTIERVEAVVAKKQKNVMLDDGLCDYGQKTWDQGGSAKIRSGCSRSVSRFSGGRSNESVHLIAFLYRALSTYWPSPRALNCRGKQCL